MKKVILSIAVVAAATIGANAQFSINPEAGLNIASMHSKMGNTSSTTKSILGYKVGAVADLTLYKGLYFEPGLFYSVKGGQTDPGVGLLGAKTKTTLNYLEIPLNIGYNYAFGDAGSVFATAGPYLGFGLNGKSKVEVPGMGSTEHDVKFGDAIDQTKKLDVGLNFSVGYVSPWGIYVRAQYGLGLSNLSNVKDMTTKNRTWGFSLGYAFQLNER